MKDEIVYFDAWWNEQCKGKREDFPCKKIAFKAWKSGVDYGKISNRSDNRWVDVKERLPESGRVLVYSPLMYENMHYRAIDAQFIEMFSGVTHWQPLPSPPKEKP